MQRLLREGYRPFFLFFPLIGATALGAWTLALRGRLSVTPTDHAVSMIWGVLGGAVLGFLLTAYPKQNDANPPSPRLLALFFGGWLATCVALLGSWLGAPTGELATALGALVWGGALGWTGSIAAVSLRRRWEPTTVAVPAALAAGLAGWLLARTGVAPGVGVALGLHVFLVGLALSLLDRLLPFFASKAVKDYAGSRRPWFVGLLLATLLLRATGVVPTRIADLLVLALLGRQLAGWRVDRLLRVPMITVLLLAVGWLGLGYAVELVRGPGPASVHFWTVGGLCTLVLGIATRVTRGHGGLPVALDRWAALALLLVQGAAVLRALLPMVLAVPLSVQLFASAGLLGAAFLIWGFRHALLLSK